MSGQPWGLKGGGPPEGTPPSKKSKGNDLAAKLEAAANKCRQEKPEVSGKGETSGNVKQSLNKNEYFNAKYN